MNPKGTKCSIKGCNNNATIRNCDTCYRPICEEHYYLDRVSGEKRDPHVFDFLMDIVKRLVEKIKKEEKDLTGN